MFFLVILFLALLIGLLWLDRKAEARWIKPAMIVSGLLALVFAALHMMSDKEKRLDGGAEFRETYLDRMRVQAEFVAQKLATDSTVEGVALVYRETDEGSPEIRKGMKRGMGDKTYVEQTILDARASSGEIDQLTSDALEAVFAAEPSVNTFIFSSMPNFSMAWRPPDGGKFVFLNASRDNLVDWRRSRMIKFAVLEKPFEEQVSNVSGEMASDLETAFKGEFNLVERGTERRKRRP